MQFSNQSVFKKFKTYSYHSKTVYPQKMILTVICFNCLILSDFPSRFPIISILSGMINFAGQFSGTLSMNISFFKYHGTGNDFILIDNRNAGFNPGPAVVARLCDRHFGIGADGLILLERHASVDFLMRYFNPDGGEATFCGNGSRCIVSFARYLGIISQHTTFMAADGLHAASVVNKIDNEDAVQVQMKVDDDILTTAEGYFIDTGSPHLVLFKENIAAIDVTTEGKTIRNQQRWGKEGVNINFAKIEANAVKLRTYERGVENETLSCGTGAVAAALVAAFAGGLKAPVSVLTAGGKLNVHFVRKKNSFENVQLEGPAKMVFAGNIRME
jgi:diaminopimelate epimerase